MDYQNIIFAVEDGIATITINRPKALNALNQATVSELKDVVEKIAADKAIKVVIITGAGAKSFVAGADIKEMASKNAAEGREWGQFGQNVFTEIENLPQPVIAAINGFALGGGCELSCACDIRYAAENAKFGQPEVGLGITPGFGGTQRLTRVVGRGHAKEVFPQEELMPAAVKLAKKIAKNAPIAVQLSKAAINRGINCDVVTGIAYEAEVFGLCFSTADQKEGMAAFCEKRKATFEGK